MSNVKIAEYIIAAPYVLGIVFIVLKLCEFISWSWFWVLSPFWIPAVIIIGSLILFVSMMTFLLTVHLLNDD